MGCALNPTHVIYVGLFFDFSFSTSVLLHWWISWLWPSTSSLVVNLKKKKKVAFLLSQPNTKLLSETTKKGKHWKCLVSAEASCRDSGRRQVIDSPRVSCGLKMDVWGSSFFPAVGLVPATHTCLAPLPLHSEVWHNWSHVEAEDDGVCCLHIGVV